MRTLTDGGDVFDEGECCDNRQDEGIRKETFVMGRVRTSCRKVEIHAPLC